MHSDEDLELAAELRGQARFCRSMASNSVLPGAAQGFLDLAAHFEDKADELERRLMAACPERAMTLVSGTGGAVER
jgi:hypothetical protein